MKVATRKIHCPNCERTVTTREQAAEGNIQVYCRRCKELIWVWDNIKWRPVVKV